MFEWGCAFLSFLKCFLLLQPLLLFHIFWRMWILQVAGCTGGAEVFAVHTPGSTSAFAESPSVLAAVLMSCTPWASHPVQCQVYRVMSAVAAIFPKRHGQEVHYDGVQCSKTSASITCQLVTMLLCQEGLTLHGGLWWFPFMHNAINTVGALQFLHAFIARNYVKLGWELLIL